MRSRCRSAGVTAFSLITDLDSHNVLRPPSFGMDIVDGIFFDIFMFTRFTRVRYTFCESNNIIQYCKVAASNFQFFKY